MSDQKEKGSMSLDEAKALLQNQRAEHMRMCSAEIAATLDRYQLNMVPRLVVEGGRIVEHGVALTPRINS